MPADAWDAGACPWRRPDFTKATRHIRCMRRAYICKMTPSVTLESIFPPGETSEPEGNGPKTWNEHIYPHPLTVQPAIYPKNQMLDQSICNDFLRAMLQQSILIYGYKIQCIKPCSLSTRPIHLQWLYCTITVLIIWSYTRGQHPGLRLKVQHDLSFSGGLWTSW